MRRAKRIWRVIALTPPAFLREAAPNHPDQPRGFVHGLEMAGRSVGETFTRRAKGLYKEPVAGWKSGVSGRQMFPKV